MQPQGSSPPKWSSRLPSWTRSNQSVGTNPSSVLPHRVNVAPVPARRRTAPASSLSHHRQSQRQFDSSVPHQNPDQARPVDQHRSVQDHSFDQNVRYRRRPTCHVTNRMAMVTGNSYTNAAATAAALAAAAATASALLYPSVYVNTIQPQHHVIDSMIVPMSVWYPTWNTYTGGPIMDYSMDPTWMPIGQPASVPGGNGTALFWPSNMVTGLPLFFIDQSPRRQHHLSYRMDPSHLYGVIDAAQEATSFDQPNGTNQELINRYTYVQEYQVVGEDDKCSICLSEFQISDLVRVLPCTHYFHVECIDRWLEQSRKCPICRLNIDHKLKQ